MKFHFRVSTSPSNSFMRDDLDDDDFAMEDNEPGHQEISLPGWDAVLWHGRLYVIVTEKQLLSGSKEAFVSLLEYAEDTLRCEHVIVCMNKTSTATTKSAIRNFLFLGFTPLAAGHEFVPSNNANIVYFVYTI